MMILPSSLTTHPCHHCHPLIRAPVLSPFNVLAMVHRRQFAVYCLPGFVVGAIFPKDDKPTDQHTEQSSRRMNWKGVTEQSSLLSLTTHDDDVQICCCQICGWCGECGLCNNKRTKERHELARVHYRTELLLISDTFGN